MNNREIIKQLKSAKDLEAFGRPRALWLASQKEILMSQIAPKEETLENRGALNVSYYWSFFSDAFKYRVLKPVAALGVILILGSGMSVAVTVADASLPGDTFYSIKTAKEKVQLALTVSASKKTEMQMNFISRRVSEINDLLVKGGEDSAKDLAPVVKKISTEARNVGDNLNRISIASSSVKEVIDLAKNIDTKTLVVGQELAKVKTSLPDGIKAELGKEIDLAIISTDQVGAAALSMIAKNYDSGSAGDVTAAEMTSRVSERIKVTEESIKAIKSLPAGLAETVSTTTVFRLEGAMTMTAASSTQVQKIIEEAKGLLDHQDFGLAIEKIQASKDLMTEALNNAEKNGSDQSSSGGEVKGERETTNINDDSSVNTSTATSTVENNNVN